MILDTLIDFYSDLAEKLNVELAMVSYHKARFIRTDDTVLNVRIVPVMAPIGESISSPETAVIAIIDALESTTDEVVLKTDMSIFTKQIA